MKIKKNDIDLDSTLMSGQAFRITKEEDNTYTCILIDRVINIKEEDDFLIVNSNNLDNLEMVVKYYLDYGRDYSLINDTLNKSDLFNGNVPTGYKVLKQSKFEMFISYIISQNNNIKRISSIVNKISEKYGKKVIFNDKVYYLFPTLNDMIDLREGDLKEFNLGFREDYVYGALKKLKENPYYLDNLDIISTDEALKSLMNIKGIGLKVASCILMFGYGKFDVFPIDTWVRKYFSDNLKIGNDVKRIKEYMNNEFGVYSGIAIQYVYHINRNRN